MSERTCSVDGCNRPHRARGLCSTCYNQQHQPERHRKVSVLCAWCGEPTLKNAARRYGARFCSLACRDAWRKDTNTNACPADNRTSCPVPWRTCPRCSQEWFRHGVDRVTCDPCLLAPRAPKPINPRWVAGSCRRCSTTFVDVWLADHSSRYCSTACGRLDRKDKRRARKKDAYVEDVWRIRIFERDGWRCQLCRRMVDRTKVAPHPLSPSLDHIVPLARGGTHEPRNVQCAHFMCNSLKGDRGYGEQLLLFG